MDRIEERDDIVELGTASLVTEGVILGGPEAGGYVKQTGLSDDD